MNDAPNRPVIAVDYYPEHWPQTRWKCDFELMQAAGITVIRIAEFAWCRLEPEADRFEFAWLEQAVDEAADYGIRTILCTPTAAPPAWLVESHPEILPVDEHGRTVGFGARRHCDPNAEAFRRRADTITRALAEHFREHTAVFAWQIDNELYGNTPSYSEETRRAFHEWISRTYPTIDEVNRRWGTIFWSQEYRGVDDIPLPGGAPGPNRRRHHPSLQMEFHRFVSAAWADFARSQATILREVNPDWTITTNAYLFRWGIDLDQSALFESLDVYSFDNYSHSLHENSFYLSMARSLKPRFWILEQQSASPQAQDEYPRETNRLTTYTQTAAEAGCELISYFRWRQCRFGQEQHHGAIIPHSGEPGDLYRELCEITSSLSDRSTRKESSGLRIGICFSWEDAWIRDIDGTSDYVSYHVESIHRGIHAAGRSDDTSYLFSTEDLAAFSKSGQGIIIVPMKMTATDEFTTTLARAAERGATVVITPDYGRKDRYNVYNEEPMPPALASLLGAYPGRQLRLGEGTSLSTAEGYTCTTRADSVETNGAEVVDTFPDLDETPAVTVRRVGSGRAIYAAGLFEYEFWKDLFLGKV